MKTTVTTTAQWWVFFAYSLTLATACTPDSSPAANDTETAQQLRQVYHEQPLVDLIAKYLEPHPNTMTNTVIQGDSTLYHALMAYENGDYLKAIEEFPNYARNPKHVGGIHLYKGVAELMAGRQFDAFKTFQRIPSRSTEAFRISNWYIALTHVVFNNKHDVKNKLQEIIDADGHNADQAAALLKDLAQYEAAQSSE